MTRRNFIPGRAELVDKDELFHGQPDIEQHLDSLCGSTFRVGAYTIGYMCGKKHEMMRDQPDRHCVKMCVKGSSEYALFDGRNVLVLSNQKLPAKYAGQRVTVNGTYDEKGRRIKVTSIEAAPCESAK